MAGARHLRLNLMEGVSVSYEIKCYFGRLCPRVVILRDAALFNRPSFLAPIVTVRSHEKRLQPWERCLPYWVETAKTGSRINSANDARLHQAIISKITNTSK